MVLRQNDFIENHNHEGAGHVQYNGWPMHLVWKSN